jgi:hypothetical protein
MSNHNSQESAFSSLDVDMACQGSFVCWQVPTSFSMCGLWPNVPAFATLTAAHEKLDVQDLNQAVLELATAPNVRANLQTKRMDVADQEISFVDGDFHKAAIAVAERLGAKCCDYILTAESIYNTNSAHQLLQACDVCLSDSGAVLLAAKRYYFGVGGSLAAFKKMVDLQGLFQWDNVATIDDGSNNVREVLRLTRRQQGRA